MLNRCDWRRNVKLHCMESLTMPGSVRGAEAAWRESKDVEARRWGGEDGGREKGRGGDGSGREGRAGNRHCSLEARNALFLFVHQCLSTLKTDIILFPPRCLSLSFLWATLSLRGGVWLPRSLAPVTTSPPPPPLPLPPSQPQGHTAQPQARRLPEAQRWMQRLWREGGALLER